jgi:hypothetical protein
MSISLLAIAIARARSDDNSEYEQSSLPPEWWLKEQEKKNIKFWMKVLIPLIVIPSILLIIFN